ncbi:hypothetical protein Tco_0779708 [Tanacetum coccineum]
MDLEHGTEKMKSPEKSPEKMKSAEKVEEEDEETKEEEDAEKEELKGFLDIITREEVPIEVESLFTKFPVVDWKTCVLTQNFMYYQVFRGDGSSKNYKVLSEMLEDFDRQDVEELYRLVKEKLYDFCGIHILLMENGLAIHMLTEKKYPLSQELLSKMLSKKLEVDHESSQAIELLSLKKDTDVDLKSNDNVSDSSSQSVEIDHLKQTLYEHLKEKESLMQIVILLKNDFKKEETKNIDREIALEKRIKQLDNIVFKRDQSAQIVHKAQQLEPKLYDGNVIKNTSAIVIPDSEETLMLAKESRSKMLLKQKDPMMLEKKVNTTPNSVDSTEPTLSGRPTKFEVPKELPKVSMVNMSLKKLKYHLRSF